MIKEKKAIIFCLNKSYVFALLTTMNILKNQYKHCYDDIVIYYDDLDSADINNITAIEPKVQFVQYTLNDFINEHQINNKTIRFENFIKKFTHLSLIKYKFIEQLKNYNKILYLDLDTVIIKDFSDIFAIQNGIAWRTEAKFYNKFSAHANFDKIPELNNIPKTHPAPNAGIFYAVNDIDVEAFLKAGNNLISCYAGDFGSVLDECSLSYAAYKCNAKITELDGTKYNVLPTVVNDNSKIVHYMGTNKIWNNEELQYCFPIWIENYRKLNLNSDKVIDYGDFGKIYQKKFYQEKWINILSQMNILSKYQHLNINFDSINTNKLELKINDAIYYEIESLRNRYKINFCIKDNFIKNNNNIRNAIIEISNNNENIFKILDGNNGIYLLMSNSFEEAKIPLYLDYVIKLTNESINFLID